MFLDFFYQLRLEKVPASTGELLSFLKTVKHLTDAKGYVSLQSLYRVGRANLAKDIKYYDGYDLAFSKTFGRLEAVLPNFREVLLQWLNDILKKDLTPEEIERAPHFSLEQLWEELKKRLAEQTEKHDGGSYWIGTGGTSPFGNSGVNPQGLRMGGEEEPQGRSAISSWNDRNFKSYRSDMILDTRSVQMALKELRLFQREGRKEIQIEKTIERTCKNGGDLEIVEERSHENLLRLILVLDMGGSMTPHSDRVSRLFSASRAMSHFKEVHTFYFHNIFHNYLFNSEERDGRISIERLHQKFRKNTKLILVGDAYMAPYELFAPPYNPYSSFARGEEEKPLSGLQSLERLREFFPSSIWLNPEPIRFWGAPTIEAIESKIPMFELSLDGIKKGIKQLLRT